MSVEDTEMPDAIAVTIREAIETVAGRSVGVLELECRIEDLGLDSLEAVELIVELEHRLDLTFDRSKAEAVVSIGDLVTLVRGTIAN